MYVKIRLILLNEHYCLIQPAYNHSCNNNNDNLNYPLHHNAQSFRIKSITSLPGIELEGCLILIDIFGENFCPFNVLLHLKPQPIILEFQIQLTLDRGDVVAYKSNKILN